MIDWSEAKHLTFPYKTFKQQAVGDPYTMKADLDKQPECNHIPLIIQHSHR